MATINVSMSISASLPEQNAFFSVSFRASFDQEWDPMMASQAISQSWDLFATQDRETVIDAQGLPSSYDASTSLTTLLSHLEYDEVHSALEMAIGTIHDDLHLLCSGEQSAEGEMAELSMMGYGDPEVRFFIES